MIACLKQKETPSPLKKVCKFRSSLMNSFWVLRKVVATFKLEEKGTHCQNPKIA
jgi:hypothetical protein